VLASMSIRAGRLRDSWQYVAKGRAINATRGQEPPSPLTDSLSAAQMQVTLFGRPAEAARALDAALAGTPLASLPLGRRPYLRLASLYAAAGRADRARAFLAEYSREVKDTVQLRLDEPSRHEALGWIAIADGKPRDAVVEFRKSDVASDGPAGVCPICADVIVGIAFDRASMPDSAIASFEHYVRTPFATRLTADAFNLAGLTKRLGELYEAKGDREKAAVYYSKFVEMWKDADPELQPQVAEIRKRLARIDTEKR